MVAPVVPAPTTTITTTIATTTVTTAPHPEPKPVRVWDLPTRVFHWSLALAVLGSVVSAKIGGNAMVWHFWCGYAVCTLLIFRLFWGLVGGYWSRLVRLVFSPFTLLRYLRGQDRPGEHLSVGHSPTGALAVLAMLALLLAQVSTGLVADDEIANVGPLNRLVSSAWAATATSWHKSWGQWLLLGLIGLHLVAIALYTWRRHPLLRAMWSGDKPLPPGTPASADAATQRGLALVLLLACAGAVAWLIRT
jgi:cytochrome b